MLQVKRCDSLHFLLTGRMHEGMGCPDINFVMGRVILDWKIRLFGFYLSKGRSTGVSDDKCLISLVTSIGRQPKGKNTVTFGYRNYGRIDKNVTQ